jgi:hypothetical protein
MLFPATMSAHASLAKRLSVACWLDAGLFSKRLIRMLRSVKDCVESSSDSVENPYLFRDTVLKLIASSNIEYKKLTATEDAA